MRSSKRPQKKSPMHIFFRLTLPAALFCFLAFVHCGYATEPPDKEVMTLFDGFRYKNLSELSEKWNVRAGDKLGPGANNWGASLIEPSPAEGKVRLRAVVERGERKASGIGLKTPLPTTGTFAANVRFSGNSDAGYSSVKAFYTYAEKPLPASGAPNHLEHDFEIISEKRHYWLAPDNVLALPVLKTITHEFTDPLLSLKSASHNRNEFVSLSSISGEYMTLVVQVKKFDISPVLFRYVSKYTLVGKTGEIPVGETVTCHPAAISHLMAMFNVWWFESGGIVADKAEVLPSATRARRLWTSGWFYYNRDSDTLPATVDRYGSLLDAGAPDGARDGVPDAIRYPHQPIQTRPRLIIMGMASEIFVRKIAEAFFRI